MPFKEFIQYWKEYIQNGHSSPKGCLYLKDWHMSRYMCACYTIVQHVASSMNETPSIIVKLNKILLLCNREFPEHNVYSTPVFFTSDWLNEYWDTLEVDDYRFVYMGPKGSWSENCTFRL